MARNERASEVCKDQQQDGSNPVTEQKPARLALRNGVWTCNGAPVEGTGSFFAAMRATVRAAGLAAAPPVPKKHVPGPQRPPGRGKCSKRLEARPWWPAYVAWRAERAAAEAERKSGEAASEDAAVWAAYRGAEEEKESRARLPIPNVDHPENAEPLKSLTLRERFLAKAARA